MLFEAFKYYPKGFFFLFLYLSFLNLGVAQNQKVADSLLKIYKENPDLKTLEKLELLRNLSFNEVNSLERSIHYADELIALAKEAHNDLYLFRGYYQKGNKYRLSGDLQKSLDAFFKGRQAAIKAKYEAGEGSANSAIADVYSVMGNGVNAELYYAEATKILRKTTDTLYLATTLLNAGDEYSKNNKLQLALANFEEAGAIFKKLKYFIGEAYTLGNIGMVYAKEGKDDLAMMYIGQSIKMLETQEDYYAISDYLIYMSEIYMKRNELQKAIDFADRSLKLAQKNKLKDQISTSNLKLSELYEKAGAVSTSYKYYKDYILYRDSVTNLKSVQQIADLRTNYEVSQKQTEVDLLNQQKKNQKLIAGVSAISSVFVIVLSFGLYRRYRFVQKTNKIIENEKKRSDTLLLNILPEETAQELKVNGRVRAKKFDSVTVLFTDFKDFTQYAENLDPERLVESVDYYFSMFDSIVEKYKLEKIKTVGDSYMCASGLPFPTPDHAIRMLHAAMEIEAFVGESQKNTSHNHMPYEIRIGMNSGPVIAGVVGTKKFAYDIWGDTVNIASRMESYSEPGKINISENTYQLVKDAFECSYRGEIEVKNKGMMKMYFVHGIKKQHGDSA